MSSPNGKFNALNTIDELKLIKEQACIYAKENEIKVVIQKSDISQQTQDRKYHQEIKNTFNEDMKHRVKHLTIKLRSIIPGVLSENITNIYAYMLIGAVAALIIASFIRKYTGVVI